MTKAALIRLLEPTADDEDVVVKVTDGEDFIYAVKVHIESVTSGINLRHAVLEVIL